jgi:hypothetical protein
MGEPNYLSADIGMHVGLRSVNITLKGTPLTQFNAVRFPREYALSRCRHT